MSDLLELGHLFAQIASGHDVARFEEIVAPDYVNHNAFAEPGLEGVKKVFAAMRAGVPDLKVIAEDVFVSAEINTLDVFIQVGAVSPPKRPS